MTKIYDAIIIGAGHNGLTAALYLARGGWKTLVLERNERIGGAIRSGEVTLPGFIHGEACRHCQCNANHLVRAPAFFKPAS